jgi:hypothetical protein
MSSPEMPEPQTPGPLETNEGPRCPNCGASISAGVTLCPNCGYTMPPLPALEGTPEDERYLTGSRTGDQVCGVLTAILLPILVSGLAGFIGSQGEVFQIVGSLLGFMFFIGPIAVQLGTRKRFPAFARAHGMTWRVLGILFVLLFLGLLALCVFALRGPH